ncbi:MAG: TPM domain-containing protein, partial [Sediminibacterium sp.]|nr:TPM domain-containing protein [Sediminibacterium sp.]
MKKITLLFCLFISTLGAISQEIISRPNPPTLLNDFAQVLTIEQQKTIEQNLDEFSINTSNQIAVVILQSLNDYPIEDYATKMLREWGIGQTKKNNGVLLLISIQEKKLKIETGYGLEGALPDITCKQIIDNYIKPSFKQGDYYAGITQGIEQIKLAAKGEFNEKSILKNKKDKKAPIKFLIL